MDKMKVAQFIKTGMMYKDIAVNCDCSVSAVNRVAFEFGIQRVKRSRYHSLSSEQWKALQNDTGGLSVKELAKKYGISTSMIYQRRKEFGAPDRPKCQRTKLELFHHNAESGIYGKSYTTTLAKDYVQQHAHILHDYGHCIIYRRIVK